MITNLIALIGILFLLYLLRPSGFHRPSARLDARPAIPHPGELWIFDHPDGSPWPREPGPIVTILEVRDGWVRYKNSDEVWPDEHTTLKTFCKLYKLKRKDG
jgi:hypothetical protein